MEFHIALSHRPVVSKLRTTTIQNGPDAAEQERLKVLKAELNQHNKIRTVSLPITLAVRDLNPETPATYIPGVENPTDIPPGPLSIN